MNLVKENLEEFIPSLVALVDGKNFPWDRIEGLFDKKIAAREAESKAEAIQVEACIYDLIIAARMQNQQAVRLLHFLDELFENLTNTLNATEKPLLKRTVQQMLESLDSKYLNFLGEIATLNNLLQSGSYQLIGIEDKMPNGKSIDFKLKLVGQDKFLLVEVVNIHLDSSKVVDDAEAISKRLTHKLARKIADKKQGLDIDVEFYLIPVIWGGGEDIKTYSEFFKTHRLELPAVVEPVAYLTRFNEVGYCKHHFGPLSTLFDC